jgi:hypothetical protein
MLRSGVSILPLPNHRLKIIYLLINLAAIQKEREALPGGIQDKTLIDANVRMLRPSLGRRKETVDSVVLPILAGKLVIAAQSCHENQEGLLVFYAIEFS